MNQLTVTTGSRLHFGLILAADKSCWHFGGAGLMVRRPGWTVDLSGEPSSDDVVSGSPEAVRRAELVLKRLREFADIPRVNIHIRNEVPFHTGLGSGTQLALAVASGVRTLFQIPLASSSFDLSRLAGRAERSAIGTGGFELGGFLIDRGVGVSPDRVSRIIVPQEWRFLLVRPEAGTGISGSTEQAYFGQQNFMPADLVSELIRILSGQIDAAIRNQDFDRFAEELERYGNLAGSFYAHEQGDIFSDPVIRKLVDHLHSRGIIGAAQSSWGPGICIPARSETHIREILTQIPDEIDGNRLISTVTEAMNHGATHAWPAPELREGHAFA